MCIYHPNPLEVQLSITFTHEVGAKIKVAGFYDGNGIWIVRLCPTLEGMWRGVAASDDAILNVFADCVVDCVPQKKYPHHGRVQVDREARLPS
jgi:hypothetical protein